MLIALPLACVLLCALVLPAHAAPYLPASDAQVLERLPARNSDPAARELQALRAAARAQPGNPDLAVRLARRLFEQGAAVGDPRYAGQAQAALAPWWGQAEPPIVVRVQRAILLQYSHRFDEALADLAAATQAEPGNGEAWSWLAAIHMVRADYPAARHACVGLAPLTSALLGVACAAVIDSLTGRAAPAAQAIDAALAAAPTASAEERLWVLTRLAEIQERRGAYPAAEAAFRAAAALGLADVYLQAAHADFLLDRGRPGEVLALLSEGGRADVLLLRLALAARAARDPRAAAWSAELSARFAAARLRGDSSHDKEEARFALQLQDDAARALQLARSNYAAQREAADARILLEAALAARQPAAAAPAREWLTTNRVESQVLQSLASRLGAAP